MKDGALCLKIREPSLNRKSATFLKFILPKFLGNANDATPPRPAFGGGTPQQNFLPLFMISPPPKKTNKEEENFVEAFFPKWAGGGTQYSRGKKWKGLKGRETFCPALPLQRIDKYGMTFVTPNVSEFEIVL